MCAVKIYIFLSVFQSIVKTKGKNFMWFRRSILNQFLYAFPSVVYFCFILFHIAALDPCDPNVYTTSLTHLDVRNPNNIIGALDSGICDKYISEQWYRVDSYDMTSRAPEAFGCGTSFPIWMNGNVKVYSWFDSLKVFTDWCLFKMWISLDSNLLLKSKGIEL